MVKQGPCGHCGVSTTPLWRNGPPDKPVLCNACGSRWRTKGTLLNYMPMHSGGCGGKNGLADRSLSHERKHFQQFKEHRSHKRKEPLDGHSDLNFGSRKSDFYLFEGFEEDTSTRSSTGSGISYSEGCIQRNFGAGYWPLQDCPIPKKNRTSLYQHRPSPAKLTQMQSWFDGFDSSAFICSTGEDLLVEYKPSSMAAEIGLGGMFIRQEAWAAQEQESIASSLMHENKDFSFLEAPRYAPSRVENPPAKFSEGIHKSLLLGEKEKTKQVPKRANARGSEKNCIPKKSFTENFSYNKHDVLRSCQSPLVLLELQDIVNFNTFMGLLTSQEQLQLMNYVSSVDASRAPESLKHMFDSSQFKSDLVNFQRLLSGGMFDSLESGLSPCVLHQYQQLLTLTDLGASGWMERCFQIVDCNKVQDSLDIVESTQGKRSLKEKVKGASAPGAAVTTSATAFGVYKNLPGRPTSLAVNGGGETVKNSVFSHAISNSASPSMLSDSSYVKDWNACELSSNERPNSSRDTDGTETVDKSGSCFSSNGFYSSTEGIGCVSQHDTMKSLMDDMVEPDILIDLPSNISFQQAELLQKPLWDRAQPIKEPGSYDELKPTGSGSLMTTNIWQAEDNLDWAGLFWNPSITGSGHLL